MSTASGRKNTKLLRERISRPSTAPDTAAARRDSGPPLLETQIHVSSETKNVANASACRERAKNVTSGLRRSITIVSTAAGIPRTRARRGPRVPRRLPSGRHSEFESPQSSAHDGMGQRPQRGKRGRTIRGRVVAGRAAFDRASGRGHAEIRRLPLRVAPVEAEATALPDIEGESLVVALVTAGRRPGSGRPCGRSAR